MANSKIIGIDLGTTNSVVSLLEGGDPKVIPNKEGSRTTPSVVAFQENGQRLVGGPARRQAITNPRNTIFSIKRFMGRRHEEVGSEEKLVPYEVVGAPKELVKVRVRGKEYTPPEISSYVLGYLKECAEDYLGEKVTRAVITVPAYFNDSQRQATKDAGRIAGLEVARIINEPTAAALAYGLDKKKSGKVAVYDLGGGTFDISILEIGDGVFEVRSTNGDTHLGGDDFDEALIHHVAEEFRRQQGIDLRQDPMALQRLKEACEKAKCDLSLAAEAQINLPFITADQSGPKHLLMTITRARFEQLCEPLFERTRKPCEQALADAKLSPRDIDEVILVGGSTRIPRIQHIVREIFGREPNRSMNPDEVVAQGAAIQGGVLAGEVHDLVLLDVTPLSLGVEVQGGMTAVLVPRNTTIPTAKKEIFTTAADGQTQVEVHVLQGERPMARDNRTLDRFLLEGLPPAPRGVPQIEVEFDIDANGILHVIARDKATGKEQKVRIQHSSGLSESDIRRMQEDAERYRDQDRRAKEAAEQRNRADQTAYQARKLLKEHRDKLEAADAKELEDKAEELERLLRGEDLEAIQRASDALAALMSRLGEKLYRGAASAAGGTGGAGSGGGEERGGSGDQVVDADYEVK